MCKLGICSKNMHKMHSLPSHFCCNFYFYVTDLFTVTKFKMTFYQTMVCENRMDIKYLSSYFSEVGKGNQVKTKKLTRKEKA